MMSNFTKLVNVRYNLDGVDYVDVVEMSQGSMWDKIVEMFVDNTIMEYWLDSESIDVRINIKDKTLEIVDLNNNYGHVIKINEIVEITG